MNIKKTRRFLKNKQKLILLGVVILGLLWVGAPYLQSASGLFSVSSSGDITAANGDYVDMYWNSSSGEPFGDHFWGYQITRAVTGDTGLTYVYTAPIVFEEQLEIIQITYTELVEGRADGDNIQIGLELWHDNAGELTQQSFIMITVGELSETNTTTTTGATTPAGEDDFFSGMGIVTAMAVGGGIIFAMAVMATAWRKK